MRISPNLTFPAISSRKADTPDLGIALPTVFLPHVAIGPQFYGANLSEIVQFGKLSPGSDPIHLGVAPDFACGGPVYLPDAFEPGKNPGDPRVVSDGPWTFIDRGSDGTKPGYYLAIYRVTDSHGQSWGFLEAYDTWLNTNRAGTLSFGTFQTRVKDANPLLQLNLGNNEENTYNTQLGQVVRFTLTPHTSIKSSSAVTDMAAYTSLFAHGDVVNGDQPLLSPVGSGLIKISNPSIGTITLNMTGGSSFHPLRISESGEVEDTSSENEVWVDSKYPGTGPTRGDFGDPFRTLGNAINAVAAGGIVKIVNVSARESPPVRYTKRMTIRALQGPITLPR
jgi:hypothetical protein